MTRNRSLASIALPLILVALAGCSGPAKSAKSVPQLQAATNLSGKVVETMDAGGYTYICLEKDGKRTWVAIPPLKVTVGQEIQLLPGAEMTQFASKTLDRTFDKIIFSGGVVPSATNAAGGTGSNLSQEPITAGKVVETMNAATYTYIRLEKNGKSAWSAVPITQVAVGDEIELQPGTAMGAFASKTLNRNFDSIYFSSGLKQPAGATAVTAEGAASAPALPSGHPALPGAGTPAPAGPSLSPITGKVVETVNAGGYTYICLENEGAKTWVAVPPMQVKVGDQLALAPGNVMTNFASKSLNRTFPTIIFSGGPVSK